MINDGLFDRFPCDAVYGLHNKPGIPFGSFALRSGPFLAASDTWEVRLRGPGGHGGSGAHLAADPTVALAHLLLGLQTIIGRNVSAVEPAVLSTGYIKAGRKDAPTALPAEVTVGGTARSFSPQVRDTLERRLNDLTRGIAAAHGVGADVNYVRGYPPTINHPDGVAVALAAARTVVGAEHVRADAAQGMGAEDFSYMLQLRPGAFIFLGAGQPAEQSRNLHSAGYDFDDRLLPIGAAYLVALARQELGAAASS
jgi:hippurate hydrolase